MVMKQIVEEYANTGVTVQMFTDPDEAMRWLDVQ
jgi:pyridoxine 5'-phosphate synthase PdxJ